MMYATLIGTNNGEHDISDIFSRVTMIRRGEINLTPAIRKEATYGAVERWNGDKGAGEIVSMAAMKRAVELAQEYGVGICAMRNSNHCLASAVYAAYARSQGCIGIHLCKGYPTVAAPGRREGSIGALPMAYALPGAEHPLAFDGCLAYASMGKLREMIQKGSPIPDYWGLDKNGEPSTDPEAVLAGARLPIGGHKGYALQILGEVLTGVLSDGCVIDEKPANDSGSIMSHTAIAIKTDAVLEKGRFEEHVQYMVERMKARSPEVHLPGEGALARAEERRRSDAFDMTDALAERMRTLSEELGIESPV